MAGAGNIFDSLQECKWRNIGFPVASIITDFTQDHAVHKRPGQDGANLEATGRSQRRFTVKALFRGGIAKGKNETWRDLYPTTYRNFLEACEDKSSGQFVHPEFGFFTCKCVSIKVELNAHKRDGVDIDVVFEETLDDDNTVLIEFPTNPSEAVSFAAALDADILNIPSLGQFNPDAFAGLKTQSFESALSQIAEIGNNVSNQYDLLNARIGNKIDQIHSRCRAIQKAVERLDNVSLHPVVTHTNRVIDALTDITKHSLLVQHLNPVHTFTVTHEVTVAALAAQLGNQVDDLIKLNANNKAFFKGPGIPVGTQVKYYQSPVSVITKHF